MQGGPRGRGDPGDGLLAGTRQPLRPAAGVRVPVAAFRPPARGGVPAASPVDDAAADACGPGTRAGPAVGADGGGPLFHAAGICPDLEPRPALRDHPGGTRRSAALLLAIRPARHQAVHHDRRDRGRSGLTLHRRAGGRPRHAVLLLGLHDHHRLHLFLPRPRLLLRRGYGAHAALHLRRPQSGAAGHYGGPDVQRAVHPVHELHRHLRRLLAGARPAPQFPGGQSDGARRRTGQAHRTQQPAGLRRALPLRLAEGVGRRGAAGPAADRRRSLQGIQRPVRPPGRRPGADRSSENGARRRPPAHRHGRPLRRRGVRGAAHGHHRTVRRKTRRAHQGEPPAARHPAPRGWPADQTERQRGRRHDPARRRPPQLGGAHPDGGRGALRREGGRAQPGADCGAGSRHADRHLPHGRRLPAGRTTHPKAGDPIVQPASAGGRWPVFTQKTAPLSELTA